MIAGPSNLNGSAICLLDDDPSVLKSTGRLLSSAGWQVQPFEDPHSFLNYARIHQPRLAVIDMAMPIMHGLEVQRRLRDLSPTTRLIILTAHDDPVVRGKAMAAGATGFFLKPVEDEEFLREIESAIKAGSAPSSSDAAAA